MYLNAYHRKLMFASGIYYFFRCHRLVHFAKNERKDEIAKDYLAAYDRTEGIPCKPLARIVALRVSQSGQFARRAVNWTDAAKRPVS